MASKHREQKVIATVACPTCGARVGELCWRWVSETKRLPATQYGRPMLCPDRRTAWQLIRDGEIKDGPPR